MSTPRRRMALNGRSGSRDRVNHDGGLYVAVVLDHQLGSVESWGPLTASRAVRVLGDLRALLAADGVTDVTVTACRLHGPGRAGHPDDP